MGATEGRGVTESGQTAWCRHAVSRNASHGERGGATSKSEFRGENCEDCGLVTDAGRSAANVRSGMSRRSAHRPTVGFREAFNFPMGQGVARAGAPDVVDGEVGPMATPTAPRGRRAPGAEGRAGDPR
jgi:hypothetical protein